jgi:hypothetical protein
VDHGVKVVFKCPPFPAVAGVDFMEVTEEFVFEPFSTSEARCFNISLLESSYNSTSKLFQLYLHSTISDVVVPVDSLTVTVVNDEVPSASSVGDGIAAAAGVLLAIFLVVIIVIMILAVLLVKKRRDRYR